ncbi:MULTISPECIES: GNAT family N-acetyltransferase [unclassified Leifsonia]|uniref:GNAT family N-acetyltransferase n=1 Tax=unclassified Leifsonia TaxID=2663824 RepID=UPI0008A7A732|nr:MULTISPECIES: GNAT family N-acetyltransferase [unclassified Leifsonia]SEI17072.1 L-amino acid N-acyltransferase YncA [Leifsonia sp. CL154]SFM09064.1 L-amino acid N-acyltransferase YncA [Leifsonia sp. CL147]
MTVNVRPVQDNEFFTWLDLYAGYGDFYENPVTDEKALLVWSWISDPGNELEAYFAVDEDGVPIGLAHVREFARPLDGSKGLYLDDLFVAPGARGAGAGSALLDALRQAAKDRGLSVVRWITAKDNATARRLYDRFAKKTSWVTYDLVP